MDGDYESEWSELYASEGIRSLELDSDDISLKGTSNNSIFGALCLKKIPVLVFQKELIEVP